MPEPGISLVGLPGTGKSTVGRLVARALGRPFVDTDALLGERHGAPAPELLHRLGESRYRELERDAVGEAVSRPGSVVATGGGAVIDPLNRWDLAEHGPRVWLDAPVTDLAGRLARSRTPRPLIGDDAEADLQRLRDARAPFYRSSEIRLDAAVAAETSTGRILRALEAADPPRGGILFDASLPRPHPQGPRHERVVLGRALAGLTIAGILAELHLGRVSVVVDRHVAAAHPPLLEAIPAARCLAIDAGETAKRLDRLGELLEWLAAARVERGDGLVVIGGGTLGDLAGLAAALYARGIPLVHVPTTWLAQVDSALGGKVAIDLPAAKNAVGAVWPAWGVVADTALLASLPVAEARNGMAEAIKAAIIGDGGLWSLIAERGPAALAGDDEAARYAITERAARVKLDVVARDPFEVGERRRLNLGHTIGHAIEAASVYRMAHGAAVALGLRGVARIAAHRSGSDDLARDLDELLAGLGFALRAPFETDAVREAMSRDKKRAGGRQRWILPLGIGEVAEVDDVTDAELDDALGVIRETA